MRFNQRDRGSNRGRLVIVLAALVIGAIVLVSSTSIFTVQAPVPTITVPRPTGSDASVNSGPDTAGRGDSGASAYLNEEDAAADGVWLRTHDEPFDGRATASDKPKILILTPVKNAARHLPRYFNNLRSLAYPRERLSIAVLESDSDDSVRTWPNRTVTYHPDAPQTLDVLRDELPALRSQFRRVNVYKKDFGLNMPRGDRHYFHKQLERRSVLAKSRNWLLSKALRDEDWVLWVDADLKGYPADVIDSLLSANKSVVVPNCVMEPGGRSYDLNSWQRPDGGADGSAANNQANGGLGLSTEEVTALGTDGIVTRCAESIAASDAVAAEALDAVHRSGVGEMYTLSTLGDVEWSELTSGPAAAAQGATMGSLVRGALAAVPAGIVHCLRDTVTAVSQNWGAPDRLAGPATEKLVCAPQWANGGSDLLVEGYTNTGNLPVHKLKDQGDIVPLDGVGGAMLLVSADLHRSGLIFPTFPYRQRIETEGLAMMARDMGHRSWGMPFVEILHK